MNMILQYILKHFKIGWLHYKLGMVNEAEKYAFLLGYNYRLASGMKLCKILNKDYEKKKKSPKLKKITF